MLANFTDITVLLDASCSMSHIKGETRQALVAFINEQQKVEGDANLTLVEFDSPGKVRYVTTNQPIRSFNTDGLTYDPVGGSTALRDAWLAVMAERGRYFAGLKESARPNRVIFVVVTDGQDNASSVSKAMVRERVQHQKDRYQWAFTYLGANQDAELEAEDLGIDKDFAITFDINNVGFAAAAASSNTAHYREQGVLRSYSSVEKLSAVDPNLKNKLKDKLTGK